MIRTCASRAHCIAMRDIPFECNPVTTLVQRRMMKWKKIKQSIHEKTNRWANRDIRRPSPLVCSPSYRIARCRFIAHVTVLLDMFARRLVNTGTAYSISVLRRSPTTVSGSLLHHRRPSPRRLVQQSRAWLPGITRNMTSDAQIPGRVAVCQICSGEDVAYNLRLSKDIVRRAAKAGATVNIRFKSGLVCCGADLHAVPLRRVSCRKRPILSSQRKINATTYPSR